MVRSTIFVTCPKWALNGKTFIFEQHQGGTVLAYEVSTQNPTQQNWRVPMNCKGFTLVELTIVVAIIGILAAIAIPNFVSMQYRAKRAEVPANVDGIKTAELAYDAAFDQFIVESTPRPSASVNKQQQTWVAGSGFDTLGWSPEGNVFFQYAVNAPSGQNHYTISAAADIDADPA